MSVAYDLASYIATTLAKGTLGTSVKVNIMTDSPTNQIAVYQTGGFRSDMGMGGGPASTDVLENPTVQVAVRNSDASTAESDCVSICKSLDGLGPVTINSVSYLFMRAMQPPYLLERDEAEVATFAFNLQIQRRRP